MRMKIHGLIINEQGLSFWNVCFLSILPNPARKRNIRIATHLFCFFFMAATIPRRQISFVWHESKLNTSHNISFQNDRFFLYLTGVFNIDYFIFQMGCGASRTAQTEKSTLTNALPTAHVQETRTMEQPQQPQTIKPFRS